MKRSGFLYEKIIDVENCRQAILNASKGKRDRKFVIMMLNDLDYYANDLSKRLQGLRFTSPYRMKHIKDKSSKKERVIAIPKFYPDLCSQHAINQVLIPLIEKSSYYYSCANFKGRGMKRANKGTKRAMNYKYCLKTDIKKFYPSIDNEKLKAFVRTKIKDQKVIAILDTLIDSTEGLPIGNYTSPQLAEWYLQSIDRLLKEKVKVKKLVRYADDNTIGDNNKRRLHYAYRVLNEALDEKGLKLKENYQLFKIHNKEKNYKYGYGRKIDFIGNCYSNNYVTIRKRTALNLMKQSRLISRLMKRKCEIVFHIASGFISRCSAFKHANSYGMRKKYEKYMKQMKKIVKENSKCGKNKNLTLDLATVN